MIKIDENDPVGELDPSFPFRDVVIKKNTDVKKFYDLQKEIGRGKFGTVYKCRERSTGLKLAAKFISIAQRQDRRNAEREVQIMRELQHPRLIQMYDAYEMNNVMCVVLELIEGGELFERVIDDDFILTEKSVSVFMRQICEGVAFIHSKNILHLDMKPENILCLTRDGNRIKIIDFGLARKYDPDKKLQVLFGTPEFVAPEVVNFESIGFGTDMWSVGVICYVLLSGLSPFMGETDVATMANVTIAQYDFDDEAFNDISKDAQDFISKLLMKDRAERMSATDCLAHPWLKRPPSAPQTANVNGTNSQIPNNELDLQKDTLRGIVDRWNGDMNAGDLSGICKIIEMCNDDAESGVSEDQCKVIKGNGETAAETKKKIKKQMSLPNGDASPARKREAEKMKLFTKGVVTGLVSGFEPKGTASREFEKSRIKGEIKKINGFCDRQKSQPAENPFEVKKPEDPPPGMKQQMNQEGSDSRLLIKPLFENNTKLSEPTRAGTKIENSADTKLTTSTDKNSTLSEFSAKRQKVESGSELFKNEVSAESTKLINYPKGTQVSHKLPNITTINSQFALEEEKINSQVTSQNMDTISNLESSNGNLPSKKKVQLNTQTSVSTSLTNNLPVRTTIENNPTNVPEEVKKAAAKTKTETRINTDEKYDSTPLTTTMETKPEPTSSPQPPPKSAAAFKGQPEEMKQTTTTSSPASSLLPQSMSEVKVKLQISKVDSKTDINEQTTSTSISPARGPSPNTLTPSSPSSRKNSSEISTAIPASSQTSPARLTDNDITIHNTTPSKSKKSIQVVEDDDSFQKVKKRNFIIQNIIENYEQKAQKPNAIPRGIPNMNMDNLLDDDVPFDEFFNGSKLTHRRISDISSLLSRNDHVDQSIEEMKALCNNLSQMMRLRQNSISESDTNGYSKRPKFRISCFSRDVPLLNSPTHCTTNLLGYVPWYDDESSTKWSLPKSNAHSDPGSLRSSPEPLAPPSLTRKILSKFFNNSTEHGMPSVPSPPSSHTATTKDKIAEIIS